MLERFALGLVTYIACMQQPNLNCYSITLRETAVCQTRSVSKDKNTARFAYQNLQLFSNILI